MQSKKISRLLVVDSGNVPVGMISLHDIVEFTNDTELKAKIITQIKRG
jgi:CBS domain-containing protein